MDINKCILNESFGPDAREYLLNKAAQEYDNGQINISVFYQVQALFSTIQDRYFNTADIYTKAEFKYGAAFTTLASEIISDTTENPLCTYNKESLKKDLEADFNKHCSPLNNNFLREFSNPEKGFETITETCKKFPKEWTILQLCKGPRPQTTYSLCDEIQKRDSDIYLTLLKHARSCDYPEPICLRFSEAKQVELFDEFFKLGYKCKEYMQSDCKNVVTREDKKKCFENLNVLEKNIKEAIFTLKEYFFPWICLFRGIPNEEYSTGRTEYKKKCFATVDDLCTQLKLKPKQRILLSLVALQVADLTMDEIKSICEEINDNKKNQEAFKKLLEQLRGSNNNLSSPTTAFEEEKSDYRASHYPCILIVDENLDHFFWEELNTAQEICRVSSIHCLQKLYTTHKAKIHKGYVCLDIETGGCIINPDNNLPNSQMRLQAFFDYWTPTWIKKFGKKPLQEELTGDYFKRSCYVYAGHGSGLQYISGKHISKQQIDAVVFLFGCDSTRMHSCGLHSNYVGPHIYYHAAKCPSLVGCILPALDAQMDSVACELLSRWIPPPHIKNFVTWQSIDLQLWIKKGIIQPAKKTTTCTKNLNGHQIGSLCGVITQVHLRNNNKLYYNTVPYVCRGLPVWNCNAQSLSRPKKTK